MRTANYCTTPVLIRSWNLFHGRIVPPRRRHYLEDMIRLVTEDRPDVVLLQEVPAWALGRLGGWSGMTAIGDVAQPPGLGVPPIPAELGRRVTAVHPRLLRSAFTGQGNAILLAPSLRPVAHEVLTLNPRPFRRATSDRLALGSRRRLAWAKERRICTFVRTEPGLVLANLHATASRDPRLPAAELARAATFVDEWALPGEVVVLGGDFNVAGAAATIAGWSAPGPGIDHILVRGAAPSPLRVWPDARRTRAGMLLSDHAPVELEL
jgi:endonuclease/exonuclease/phosphatase family metal-dependent hydrolase